MSRNPSYLQSICVTAMVLLASIGCNSVQKRIVVRSNPPGANVMIDRQYVGQTPVSTPFVYHGTRQIQLEKDGYKTIQVEECIPPRWYERVPFSFVADNFWPREIRDERVLDFELDPKVHVSESRLQERADELRNNVQQNTIVVPFNR
ncbi:MAG: PEGA domain-containing protein [Pirellulaceae bacterium]